MLFTNFLDVSMQLFSRWFFRCSASWACFSKRVSMIFKDWLETCSKGSVAFVLEVLSVLSVGFGALAMLSLLCVFKSVPSLMHLPLGQAMRSNAKQCNPMSFCCTGYSSVLCIICGPKSFWRQIWTFCERLAGYMFEVSLTFGSGPSLREKSIRNTWP